MSFLVIFELFSSFCGFAFCSFALSNFAFCSFALSNFAFCSFALSNFAFNSFALSNFALSGFALSGFAELALEFFELFGSECVVCYTCVNVGLENIHEKNANEEDDADYDGELVEDTVECLALLLAEECLSAAGDRAGKSVVLAALKKNRYYKEYCHYK